VPRKKPEPKKIDLTAEQELVVAAKEGAYRVAASPGSGKSSVLVQRYIRLLQSGVSVDDILSLTFTSTAAKNLRDRVEERVGKLSINREVAGACTFHSLCLSLAVEERAEYPVELEEFPLATEPVAAKFSAIAASKYEVDARSLRSAISLYKRKKIRPAEAVRIAENNLKAAELKTALAYKMYDKSLRDTKVLDFDSLILEAVELLSKKKEVRNRWQYQFVQVDEAQDCCAIEWQLIQLLTEKHGNLVAVGDANQNLYTFRGSNASLFVDMEQMFPGTKKLFLGRNFRSTPEIVSFVKEIGTFRELCEHFTTENEHGPAPLIKGFATAADEAAWIVKRIKGETNEPSPLV
jgi:DNA helicase-2/ATP-dependent DNA helicase PcrA